LNDTGSSNSTENLTSTSSEAASIDTPDAKTGNFSATESKQENDKTKSENDPADFEIPKVLVNVTMPAFATKKIEKMPVRLPIKPKMASGPDEPLSVYVKGQEFGTGVIIEFSAPIDFRDFQDPTSIFELMLEPLLEMDRKLQASSND